MKLKGEKKKGKDATKEDQEGIQSETFSEFQCDL